MNRRKVNRLDADVIAANVEITYYKRSAYKPHWYEYHGLTIDVYFWR